jgi:hypothetical protein
MIPMRSSTIFKSRWMALVWAAGFIWFAYDVASSEEASPTANSSDQVTITDGSGAPVSPTESNELEEALKNL